MSDLLNKTTYSFCKHGREESSIVVCNQATRTMKSFALMNQHITSSVLKFICYYQTIYEESNNDVKQK